MSLIDQALFASFHLYAPLTLPRTVFLNSAPKSGTHLVRNILLHIFGDAVHIPFVTDATIGDEARESAPHVIVGHVPLAPEALAQTRATTVIQLVRHPIDLLIGVARSAFDPRNERPDYAWVRNHLSLRDHLPLVAAGYEIAGLRSGPFADFLQQFMVGWARRSDIVLTYEDVVTRGETVIAGLLDGLGVPAPLDLAERIAVGSQAALSATYLPPLDSRERTACRQDAADLLSVYCPGVIPWYETLAAQLADGGPRHGLSPFGQAPEPQRRKRG